MLRRSPNRLRGGGWLAGVAVALVAAPLGCSDPPAAPRHRVFVSQAGSRTVAVIDPERGETIKRITVGALPHRLLVDAAGRALYVVLVGSQAIAEIDLETLALRRTFLTAPVPERRDDGTVIAPHAEQQAFTRTTCFDCHHGAAGTATPPIVGSRPFGFMLSADRSELVVCHLRTGELTVLDRPSGQLVRHVPLLPTGAAREVVDVAQVGPSLFVALRPAQPATTPGVIRRLDARTYEPQGEVPTGADPVMVLPLPDRAQVLVSNFESNTVSAFDTGGAARSYTVTPGPLGLLPLPGGHRALSLNYYSNSVSLIDLDSGVVRTVPLALGGVGFPNPTHAALSPDGRRVYIVSSGTQGRLLVFDLEQERVVRVFPIDGLSFDVAVAPVPTHRGYLE
jgi:DNA-binding beta-propeller fold protein YncE